ncbi:hypothetical protein NL108_008511 [Boleophthalmus pectinirostris]|nr:hypothetical protein NL108_008511 [Boleophthalmus pectinirostris]
MDPAEPNELEKIVATQGNLLGQHHKSLLDLRESNQNIGLQVSNVTRLVEHLSNQLSAQNLSQPSNPTSIAASAGASAVHPPRETPVPHPEPYNGDLGKTKGFLLQCKTVFTCQPLTFSTDHSKVAFITGLLRGRALDWAEAMLGGRGVESVSYSEFFADFKRVFTHPDYETNAAKGLLDLHQGNKSVADYSIQFRILAEESGWNDAALKGVFWRGLTDTLKDQLAARDETTSLEELISLAIRLDNRLRERCRERTARQVSPFPHSGGVLVSHTPTDPSSSRIQLKGTVSWLQTFPSPSPGGFRCR